MPLDVLAIGLTGLLAAAPTAADHIERLADPDPEVRRVARQELEALGSSALPALRAAAADDDAPPAVTVAADRLVRRFEIVADAPVALLDPSLVRAAIQANSPDPAARRAGLDSLVADPVYAAPLLARLIVEADETELRTIADRLAKLHVRTSWSEPGRHDRSALVGALLKLGPQGRDAAARWLRASDRPKASTAVAAGLLDDPDLQAWAAGDAEATLPPASLPDAELRPGIEAARRVLLGLPPDANAPADETRLQLLCTLAQVDQLDNRPILPADVTDADPLTQLAAACLAADDAAIEAAQARLDVADTLGVLFDRGQYASFVNADDLPRWANDNDAKLAARSIKRTYEQALLKSNGNGRFPEAPLGKFHDLRMEAVEGRSHEAASMLARVDPAEAAWALLAADQATPGTLHPALDDVSRRLATLDLLWSARPEETDWLADELRTIATLSLLDPWDAARLVPQVADRFDDLGDPAAAARCYAALVALLTDPAYADVTRRTVPPALVRLRPAAGVVAGASGIYASRCRMAIAAGDLAAADVARARELAITPLRIGSTIDWVRALDAAGETERANIAFAEQFERIGEQVKAFETSHMLLNEGAWLAARSSRRLSTALDYARRAIQLRPATAYWDTLAEIHAANGDVRLAGREMERALVHADEEWYGIYARRAREVAATAAKAASKTP